MEDVRNFGRYSLVGVSLQRAGATPTEYTAISRDLPHVPQTCVHTML